MDLKASILTNSFLSINKMEEWKKFDKYLISNLGRVMNGKTGRILKPNDDKRGYLKCCISIDGIVKTYKVHQLVALCFIGERPFDNDNMEFMHIDHIDRNKYNNSASNLRYVTRKENARNTDHYRHDIEETDPKLRRKLLSKKRKICSNNINEYE